MPRARRTHPPRMPRHAQQVSCTIITLSSHTSADNGRRGAMTSETGQPTSGTDRAICVNWAGTGGSAPFYPVGPSRAGSNKLRMLRVEISIPAKQTGRGLLYILRSYCGGCGRVCLNPCPHRLPNTEYRRRGKLLGFVNDRKPLFHVRLQTCDFNIIRMCRIRQNTAAVASIDID